MSFIFKKLSVLFCCLFCLVSLNSVVSADTGDYLVYFLGKDENNVLECGRCGKYLRLRSGQFSCPKHCFGCASINMWGNTDYFCYGSEYHNDFPQKCTVNIIGRCIKDYGPFCFINYENGGNFDTVFENAKKSGKLYCAYCMAKELNGDFSGKISFNVPEIETYDVLVKFKDGRTLLRRLKMDEKFRLKACHVNSADNECDLCRQGAHRDLSRRGCSVKLP